MPDSEHSGVPVDRPPDTHPTPTRWILRWPWGNWTGWQRTSVAGHLVTRALIGVAGLASALVLIVGFGPQAYQSVFWRDVEYAQLGELHAGNSLDFVIDQLGRPAFVKQLEIGSLTFQQHIFARREHLVMAVTDQADEVVLLSVLSCSPDFAPAFLSPVGTTVRLQSVPLGRAIQGDPESGWVADEHRRISYVPWSTASSMNQLVEEGAAVSNASRGRAYFVGVNGACAELDSLGLGQEPFAGELSAAPDPMAAARDKIAANFYAETVDLEASLGENAQLDILVAGEAWLGLVVSPYHFDLPLGLLTPTGTRRF